MISDYGLSKILKGKAVTYAGTPFYMPPEVAQRDSYDFGTDIWALGIVFLQMVNDKRIWDLCPGGALPCNRDDFPQSFVEKLPTKACKKLIGSMLDKNPAKRMKIGTVVYTLENQNLFFEEKNPQNVPAEGKKQESGPSANELTADEINPEPVYKGKKGYDNLKQKYP